MGFNQTEGGKLLAACHRRCCVCHRYCGIKIELHHIVPEESGGSDKIENAIPLCFECHAEIQLYNDKHPRGRKFRPSELQAHKQQWLKICKDSPDVLLLPQRPYDVGPIQALIDELEFNNEIARRDQDDEIGALFLVEQFQRAIHQGIFSLLPDGVKTEISKTYATLMRANMYLQKMGSLPWGGSSSAWHQAFSFAKKSITCAQAQIPSAIDMLLKHLGHSENLAISQEEL